MVPYKSWIETETILHIPPSRYSISVSSPFKRNATIRWLATLNRQYMSMWVRMFVVPFCIGAGRNCCLFQKPSIHPNRDDIVNIWRILNVSHRSAILSSYNVINPHNYCSFLWMQSQGCACLLLLYCNDWVPKGSFPWWPVIERQLITRLEGCISSKEATYYLQR